MRRDHALAQRRMSEFVDGELAPRRARRLAAHADLCPECGPMLRSLTRMVDELHFLEADRGRESIAPAVLARLRAEDEAHWSV